MKILYVTSLFPNTLNPHKGIFNLSRVKALRKLGHEIKVISPIGLTPPNRYLFPCVRFNSIRDYCGPLKRIPFFEVLEQFEIFHPKWYWLPRKWFWKYEVNLLHLFTGRKIRKILDDFEPDVIIGAWIHPFGTIAKYIKKRFNIPFFAIAEGSDLLVYPKMFKGINSIIDIINNNIEKVIFVSQNMREKVVKKYNVKNSVIIQNGYDNELFYYNNFKAKRNGEKYKIISVGNLEPIKGYDLLLKAVKNLDNNFHLTIVGDGTLRNEYEEYVRVNTLQDIVTFTGYISHQELKYFYDKSDLFVLPSISESFGIVVLEAMACGLPVVANDVGEVRNIIRDGFNGFFVDQKSVASLRENILKAMNRSWNNLEIAQWIKDKYSWIKWAKNIDMLIEEFV